MEKPRDIIDFFGQMLSRREYLIPLVAAQFQFPNHYYPFTAAALLEDLFVDAAINYKNEFHRGIDLTRPEKTTKDQVTIDAKGEKGWDYRFEGENYSHKVGRKIQDIGLLWDATFKLPEDGTYSYPSPMIFALSNYKNTKGVKSSMTSRESNKLEIKPLSLMRNRNLESGQNILILKWNHGSNWEILNRTEISSGGKAPHEYLPLSSIWEKMMNFWTNGTPANSIEVFVTNATKSDRTTWLDEGEMIDTNFKALPGIYLFPKSYLQNIKVKKNNRAILLPTSVVETLVENSFISNQFVLCPNWYSYYATPRSVDLYQVQRSEYDRLNTAARN